MSPLKLTVIAPVYNEEQVIAGFHARTRAVLAGLDHVVAEILFVLDRSTDNTLQVLREVVRDDPHSKVLVLSSRFGHQMSLLAGIEHALDADCIVMMDSDLQHPPELIPQLLAQFRNGCDVVYTVRRDTQDIGWLRKWIGNMFYAFLGMISHTPVNANASDFRLISRRVGKALSEDFRERNMFLRGLFTWMGFNQASVEYEAAQRHAGRSKYSLSRMLQLAIAGILSFSSRPLYLGMVVGIGFAFIAFLFIVFSVVSYFIDRSIPSGWTTLVTVLLLFSGIQLIVLGIMGAYIGGIYDEVKQRPRYLIDQIISHHDQAR